MLYCKASDSFFIFRDPFIYTENTHGTGCTLATAIASGLAKGKKIEDAVREGKEFVTNLLKSSRFLHVGKGRQGVMNHMFQHYLYE